jgi:homoserine O-acetyltransferase
MSRLGAFDETQNYPCPACRLRLSWQYGDISANPLYKGDFDRALGSITAKAIVMPGRTDLYFPPEDSEYEVSKMPNAQLRPIESV